MTKATKRPAKARVSKARAKAAAPGSAPLNTQAYDQIREMILSGDFPAAEALREVDLVRLLKVSRTPVREALQRLHAEGLISPLPGGGYAPMAFGLKEVTDHYQVMEVLTGLAARLAAGNPTRVGLAHLQDALETIERAAAAQDLEQLDEGIGRFLHSLSEASQNAYLHLLNMKMVDLFRYRPLAVDRPDWQERLARDFRIVVEAIAAGDAERAGSVAAQHIGSALQRRRQELSGGAAPFRQRRGR